MAVEQHFDQFAIGDHIVFTHRFGAQDFSRFAVASGERNPLHHDPGYAPRSGLDRPIVPLHLVLAPLSKVAGMVFHGEPSLYLGHEVRAITPVLYDEDITYSARITAMSPSQRVLTIRVLGLSGTSVLFEATMRVQARSECWETPPAEPIRRGLGAALVTGAGGEIGDAIARRLANAGYHLLLHVRASERAVSKREPLVSSLGTSNVHLVEGDLGRAEGRAILCSAARRIEDLSLVVHTASPPIDAPLNALMEVNFTALHELAEAALPALLRRQEGAIVALGSTAAEFHPAGWEGYVGAKVAAASLIDGLHRRYAPYGVRGHVIALGYVRTAYSRAYLPPGEEALLPEEVAEALLEVVAHSSGDSYHVVDVRGKSTGRFGFVAASSRSPVAPSVPGPLEKASADNLPAHSTTAEGLLARGVHVVVGPDSPAASQLRPASADVLASVVRRVLRLPIEENLDDAGLGITSRWDSLRHIELLLEVESTLGIRFTSGEIESTRRFRDLAVLCHSKVNEPGSSRG